MDAKIIFMDFQIQSMYLFDGRILSFLRTPTDLTRFLEAWHSNASSFQFCALMKRKIILVLLAFMYNFRFQVCTHSMVTFYFQFDVLSD